MDNNFLSGDRLKRKKVSTSGQSMEPEMLKMNERLGELKWHQDMFDLLSHQLPTLFERMLSMGDEATEKNENVHLLLNTVRSILRENLLKESLEGGDGENSIGALENSRRLDELREIRGNILRLIKVFQLLIEGNPALSSLIQIIELIVEGPESNASGPRKGKFKRSNSIDNQLQIFNNPSRCLTLRMVEQQPPLENHVILKELVRKMSGPVLLNIRLVNHQWNEICLRVTQNFVNSHVCVKFKFDKVHQSYRMSSHGRTTEKSLAEFNEFLNQDPDRVSNFPTRTFHFKHGDLGAGEALAFFQTHGRLVHTLKLNLKADNESVDDEDEQEVPQTSKFTLRKILLDFAPNLKHLNLRCTPQKWDEDGCHLFPEPLGTIKLANLTSVTLGQTSVNTPVVWDILGAALNLSCLSGFSLNMLDSSSSSSAVWGRKIMDAVQYFTLKPKPGKDLTLFCEKWPMWNLQLKRLQLNLNEVMNERSTRLLALSAALEGILKANCKILEEISPFYPVSFLPSLKLPQMDGVRRICFLDWDRNEKPEGGSDFRMLPEGQKLSHVFPSLEHCEICWEDPLQSDEWENYLDFSDVVPSVQRLDIHFESCPLLYRKTSELFPNVRRLFASLELKDFLDTLRIIWVSFVHLQDVTLNVYKYKAQDIVCSRMDSAITGIPPNVCEQLQNSSRSVGLEQAKNLREDPSIFCAKKLTSLKIRFAVESGHAFICKPIFTHVAGIYGFQPLRELNKLTVTIRGWDNEDAKTLGTGLVIISHYVDEVDCAETHE